jgi:hypothetical protein
LDGLGSGRVGGDLDGRRDVDGELGLAFEEAAAFFLGVAVVFLAAEEAGSLAEPGLAARGGVPLVLLTLEVALVVAAMVDVDETMKAKETMETIAVEALVTALLVLRARG